MSAAGRYFAAVFSRLTADTSLANYQHASMSAAGVGIYDRVPSADDPRVLDGTLSLPRAPYLSMGTQQETKEGAILGGSGFSDVLQVHAWDDYNGRARVLEILRLVDVALTASPLTVTGFSPAYVRMDFVSVLPDPSGWMHGVYQARIEVL